MGVLDDVEKHFGCRCLYTALNLKKDASEKEIKRAYHKFSLLCHPDRSSDENKDINKAKFQSLAQIHSILSNTESRKIYDETGELRDESDIFSKDHDWDRYWRLLFKKITKKDVELFESEYRFSEKEEKDLKFSYLKYEGDMNKILDHVLCCTVDDEERFSKIIFKWIDDGEVPNFETFSNESEQKKKNRKRQAKKEATEAKAMAKELGIDQDDSLENMILARKVDREKETNDFFASLEAKYCRKENEKTKKVKSTTSSKSTKRKRK